MQNSHSVGRIGSADQENVWLAGDTELGDNRRLSHTEDQFTFWTIQKCYQNRGKYVLSSCKMQKNVDTEAMPWDVQSYLFDKQARSCAIMHVCYGIPKTQHENHKISYQKTRCDLCLKLREDLISTHEYMLKLDPFNTFNLIDQCRDYMYDSGETYLIILFITMIWKQAAYLDTYIIGIHFTFWTVHFPLTRLGQ